MNNKNEIPKGFEPIKSENPFGKAVGPIFEKKDGDGWVRGFRVGENHTNQGRIAHGGVLMTFADIVLARAVLDVAPLPFATVQMSCQFVAPALWGAWIEGRGKVTRRTRDLVFVSCELISAQPRFLMPRVFLNFFRIRNNLT
ncbi:MAG: PaaI family thioesterase [Sphingomonadales bacterium]